MLHHTNVVQGLVCTALFRTLLDVLFCAVSFIYELVLLRLHLHDICFPCIFFPQKQRYQDQTATSNGPKATHFHMLSTDSNHVSAGFSREGKHSHKDQAGHSNMQHKGKKCKTKNKHNVNKQQDQGKKTKGQKTYHHQQRGRGRSASRGGSHQTRPNLRNRGGDRKNQNDAQVSKRLCFSSACMRSTI